MTQTFEQWRDSLEAKPGDKIIEVDDSEYIFAQGAWFCSYNKGGPHTSAKFLRRVVASRGDVNVLAYQDVYHELSTWTAEPKRKHEWVENLSFSCNYCKNCDVLRMYGNDDSECPGKPGNTIRTTEVNSSGEYVHTDTPNKTEPKEESEVEKFVKQENHESRYKFTILEMSDIRGFATAIKTDILKETTAEFNVQRKRFEHGINFAVSLSNKYIKVIEELKAKLELTSREPNK